MDLEITWFSFQNLPLSPPHKHRSLLYSGTLRFVGLITNKLFFDVGNINGCCSKI